MKLLVAINYTTIFLLEFYIRKLACGFLQVKHFLIKS